MKQKTLQQQHTELARFIQDYNQRTKTSSGKGLMVTKLLPQPITEVGMIETVADFSSRSDANLVSMTRDALVVGINQYPFLKDSSTSKAKHLKTPAADAEAIALTAFLDA